ncbi:argininosuccinate synthase [Desulfarculus baarsii DSM 2075]|uniref:Argininosuccinate synthase n=1 Tax=Desulfarculus baarsii (strain ATCC 33931 / DSM 2075 / LMG 7858 / VKM B-1802 / 2st14) TaxID=644282 RepID=E1QI53_DESB2|nr:argininosuccinate synthase [Desulfarculus baarsii]ADK85246.1 argininosuccinate synthase [Desulfarculus baarsii DSM 2075]
MANDVKSIVLAYSGGLDTSIILKWLQETYDCQVIAFAADLGQGEELEPVREKAIKTGASKVFIDDLREEFARDYVFPMFRANAIYESVYLLGTSIARPLIAKRQIEIALAENADAVAHGATGKGNDQVRFELAYQALAPQVRIIAPWRIWDLNSRESLIAYAQKHGIPVPVTKAKPYSSDRNLLHISFEGGILEDPWAEPPEDMYVLSVSPKDAPDQAEEITLDFEAGDAVAIDGQKLSPAAMLARLNELGGKHGVGRVDLVENRYVGMKSRGVYETPGGTILRQARLAMESLTLDREVLRLRDNLAPKYAEMVYYGYWFSPERALLQSLMDQAAAPVCGQVRLKLYKGNVTISGRRSPGSLYRPDFATFEADTVYNQADATGFIRLNGLRLRIRHALDQLAKK